MTPNSSLDRITCILPVTGWSIEEASFRAGVWL
jgi:hypothetical protein